VDKLLKKKPHMEDFLHEVPAGESEKEILKEVFGEEEE
jgi:hypothetical protein